MIYHHRHHWIVYDIAIIAVAQTVFNVFNTVCQFEWQQRCIFHHHLLPKRLEIFIFLFLQRHAVHSSLMWLLCLVCCCCLWIKYFCKILFMTLICCSCSTEMWSNISTWHRIIVLRLVKPINFDKEWESIETHYLLTQLELGSDSCNLTKCEVQTISYWAIPVIEI